MPKNLYLTLVNGRTIHVTDDWDGVAPTYEGTVDAAGAPDDGEGIEAGDYYRDIYRIIHSGSFNGSNSIALTHQSTMPGLGSSKSQNFVGGVYDVGVVVSETLTEKSDDAAHAKPRTWQKVCTWLVFNCVTSGQKRKWRAASVDGYSDQPPIDD